MSQWKRNKKILFSITGGIAAYKAPEILRGWVKAGCEVETILTESAEQFVSPLVLSTLSKRRAWLEEDFLSREQGWKIPHISLTEWADVFVVAPCTANVLRICAEGDGGTLLGAAMLANHKPLVLFPAMNSNMWANPAAKRNKQRVIEMGHTLVDPDEGPLACGYEGKGRLPSDDVINAYVWRALYPQKDLAGKRVLVTAGPTHEYIDPVRYLSNPSSGKMGFELARNAWYRGAEVVLVSGPTHLAPPEGVIFVPVVSAQDMYDACMDYAPDADIIVKAAAVGDYRAPEISAQKIKRHDGETLHLDLVQNPDIAAALGKEKKPGQVIVGFAAETNDLVENAAKKLAVKNLDMIVANDVLAQGAGFASDTNSVKIIAADGRITEASGTKEEVAKAVLDAAAERTSR